MLLLIRNVFLLLESIIFSLKKKKYIIFVVHNDAMLSYVMPVYELLKSDSRLRLFFCFTAPDKLRIDNLPLLKKKHRLFNVPYRIAELIKWDLIVFPDHKPYFRKDCKKIYIGHGFYVSKLVDGESYIYGSRSFNNSGDIIYDKFFETSEYVRDVIKENYPQFSSRVKAVGSLLIESIHDSAEQRNKVLSELKFDPKKDTVMVASTWGENSFIQNQGRDFVKIIPKVLEDYNLIVFVHLLNYRAVNGAGQLDCSELFKSLSLPGLYILNPGEAPYRYLACADVLMADMTSLSLYYTVFKKPVIFFDNQKVMYEPGALIGDLRKAAYVISNISKLADDIARAKTSFDSQAMERLIPKIFSYYGSASMRYLEEIYGTLSLSIPNN